jgi:putative transposase
MLPSFLTNRFVPELRGFPGLTPKAARAYWKALHLLGLGFARRLTELRSDSEPLTRAHGEVEELSLVISTLWEVIDLLRERMDRLPDKHRPQHTPRGRFRSLRAGRVLKLSSAELAWLVSVSEATVKRWQSEMGRADDDTRTIGKTVRPTPPLRRYADVVEHLCQALAFAGLSGQRMIASTLARAGYVVSRSTVRRRLRKAASVPPEPTAASRRAELKLPRAVTAKRPNHVWLADLTLVRGLFGLRTFHVAVILDVFSRLPLVAEVYGNAPTSADLAALFRSAVKGLGAPVHFITDQGPQFTGKAFTRALCQKGVRHRFGAVGRHGSIAIIERFWLTAKTLLALPFWKPLLAEDLERRLAAVLLFYSAHRPHSSLRGATPMEAYARTRPACRTAIRPPLATARDAPTLADFHIRHLDREQRLPVLARAA